ncbi:SPOR domain-containing protein [Primorskyibacter sp. 2E107]|uniref:SPOR domain-containing protein n=1 Tax=Primorskyibacter sp. 2E107 TaxID=3403458 RepID=UPI003AF8A1EC
MTLKSLTIFALVAAGMGIASTAAMAQGIDAIPANFPPASYQGRQFVDNKGCVFVRAGFDGTVTWVPRVTRQRNQICGQTPTFGGGDSVTAAAPAPAPQQRPVQITNDAPAAAKPAPGIKVATPSGNIRVLQSDPNVLRPAGQTAARQPVIVQRAPASKPAAAEPPRMVRRVPAPMTVTPQPAPREIVRAAPPSTGAGPCINGSSTRIVDGRQYVSACGTQRAPQVSTVRRGWKDSALSPSLAPETRIVPRKIYQRQQQVVVNNVPEGYRPAWSDDRLNPYRGYQTVQGYRDTQQVWTNTAPRILTSDARRHILKEPPIAYVGNARRYPVPVISTGGTATKEPVISTRSTPKASGARFVQVGVFTTEAKAQAAASRLSAAGLPVRFGTFRQGGETLRRVMVGPYNSEAALNAGLRATKSAGYVQSYLQ